MLNNYVDIHVDDMTKITSTWYVLTARVKARLPKEFTTKSCSAGLSLVNRS
jgi:hypothetical protein